MSKSRTCSGRAHAHAACNGRVFEAQSARSAADASGEGPVVLIWPKSTPVLRPCTRSKRLGAAAEHAVRRRARAAPRRGPQVRRPARIAKECRSPGCFFCSAAALCAASALRLRLCAGRASNVHASGQTGGSGGEFLFLLCHAQHRRRVRAAAQVRRPAAEAMRLCARAPHPRCRRGGPRGVPASNAAPVLFPRRWDALPRAGRACSPGALATPL